MGIAAAALFAISFARIGSLQPRQESGTLPTQPATPYFHYLPGGQPLARALVVHGLNSNKAFMQLFCAALADAGFEVYAIDLPGHGDSTAGFNGVLAESALNQAVTSLMPDIAIGHSMGGSLLIDLAHRHTFRKLVLISPGTTEVNDLIFENTLVTAERFDIPAINTFVPLLAADGAHLMKFEWGMHSSALLKADQIHDIVAWLGGDTSRLQTGKRIGWLGCMFLAAVILGIAVFPARAAGPAGGTSFSKADVVMCYVVASAVAVTVLHFVVVLRWIHLFAMDYMISFLFVAGVVLVGIATNTAKASAVRGGDIGRAVGAAAYVIVVLGLLAGSHLIHMTLSDGRWWRFVVIAIVSLPLFLFDEMVLREVGSRAQNFGLGIVTRLLITAGIATGALIFNRQSDFIVLLLALFLLFWITLWLVTGFIARYVRNPVGAALFAALVQGWMFAAWFVIT